MAYRNLKSVVPLLRPGELFDRQLAELDRGMFGGHDPAALLHDPPGHRAPDAHPLGRVRGLHRLPAADDRPRPGLLARPAGRPVLHDRPVDQLGAGRRELLPAAVAGARSTPSRPPSPACPPPRSRTCRAILLDQRLEFLRDPATGTPQSIAGFASLHISMSFTAAVAAHLLGLGRRLKIGLWIWFAVTTASTIYLGWHYVLDDLGGVILGAMAARPGRRASAASTCAPRANRGGRPARPGRPDGTVTIDPRRDPCRPPEGPTPLQGRRRRTAWTLLHGPGAADPSHGAAKAPRSKRRAATLSRFGLLPAWPATTTVFAARTHSG